MSKDVARRFEVNMPLRNNKWKSKAAFLKFYAIGLIASQKIGVEINKTSINLGTLKLYKF